MRSAVILCLMILLSSFSAVIASDDASQAPYWKTNMYWKEILVTIDYEEGLIDVEGRETSIIIDGDVNPEDTSVRFYNGTVLIDAQLVAVNERSNTTVTRPLSAAGGIYSLSARIDEDNIKIESIDSNNADSADITFAPCTCGDSDGTSKVDIDDVVYIIVYIFAGGNPPCDIDGDGTPDC